MNMNVYNENARQYREQGRCVSWKKRKFLLLNDTYISRDLMLFSSLSVGTRGLRERERGQSYTQTHSVCAHTKKEARLWEKKEDGRTHHEKRTMKTRANVRACGSNPLPRPFPFPSLFRVVISPAAAYFIRHSVFSFGARGLLHCAVTACVQCRRGASQRGSSFTDIVAGRRA